LTRKSEYVIIWVDFYYFRYFVGCLLKRFLQTRLQKWMVSPSYVILNFAVLSSSTVPQTGSLIDICCLFASRIDCVVHPFMVSGV